LSYEGKSDRYCVGDLGLTQV